MKTRSAGGLRRRDVLAALAAAGVAPLLLPCRGLAQPAGLLTRPIPSSGETLPLVGLGSWITFNVGEDTQALDSCTEVMRAFFDAGGRMIDSSPMYGSSQATIGYGLEKLGAQSRVFAATKVWTSDGGEGPAQIEESRQLWRLQRFDLLMVHNLDAWEAHLPMLFAMKAAGQVRYVGVTTSHGRRHGELEAIMTSQPLDFVQVTYNVADREVEERILPLAAERGIAVICNRPFRGGALLEEYGSEPLPSWAGEIDCANWAQILLKFIVSHPSITCAIPATTRVDHVQENVGASFGRMPDAALRARMASDIEAT